MRLVAALALLALVPAPARAVDPSGLCVARKLRAVARSIASRAACHVPAVRRGIAVDASCVARAEVRLAARYPVIEAQFPPGLCLADDGLARVEGLVDQLVREARRRLDPPSGGSRCQAAKLAAALGRATRALEATARALPGSPAARAARRRARRLGSTIVAVHRRFDRTFRRLETRGGCATTADGAAVAGAMDAGLDVLGGALNVVRRETVTLPSPVTPANTPGSPGVAVTGPTLLAQFDGAVVDLNHVTFTRWRLVGERRFPDAVLILVPGFGGGAGNFEALAENLISRLHEEHALIAEVWGHDRRTEQLEDRAGVLVAAAARDPLIALDWFYGAELGLALHPALAAGPNRRAVFHDTRADVPFIANWTPLVFSRDLDVVVETARTESAGAVFLGGHSAGTGFAARYAATDLNLAGSGAPRPGWAKLRGLVLLEGGGGSTARAPLTDDTLDRMIAKHDGGLFGAVRDGAPRCVDGTTPCTVATESADCAGLVPPRCTPSEPAHGVILGLSPKVLAAAEPAGVQALSDPDGGQVILQVDQGTPGNNAISKVPELGLLVALAPGTVEGLFGQFLDDDGLTAAVAPAFAASVGAPGPVVGGLVTWLDLSERAGFPLCPGVGCVTPDNGPAPTALPAGTAGFWGAEREVTRIDRLRSSFAGVEGANASDWYYPLSGLGVTTARGVCTSGTCAAGNVGAVCATDGDCTQSVGLDSRELSVGRGRPDIENLTQAAGIALPVLCVGGSNGLTSVPARFLPFAQSIAPCAAPTCDGTPRVRDPAAPSPAFPTFGGVAGGFEVVIAEGFSHLDVVSAEDDADNPIVAALAGFMARNGAAAP